MDSIPLLISQSRKNLGLTQAALSQLSKISLPNLQKIETGRGNPSLFTLTAIFTALGRQIDIVPKPANWDLLAACGAPLLLTRKIKMPQPTTELLLTSLRAACIELQGETEPRELRKLEAVQTLLFTVKKHFPNYFKAHIQPSPLLLNFVPHQATGRIIKLKRQTLSKLSRYL